MIELNIKTLLKDSDLIAILPEKLLQDCVVFTCGDQAASWELLIELITRVAIPQDIGVGLEQSALDSLYSLFSITRDILKKHESECINFAKIVVPVLNKLIRPFTTEWHKKPSKSRRKRGFVGAGAFNIELKHLQETLKFLAELLTKIVGVEDLVPLIEEKQK